MSSNSGDDIFFNFLKLGFWGSAAGSSYLGCGLWLFYLFLISPFVCFILLVFSITESPPVVPPGPMLLITIIDWAVVFHFHRECKAEEKAKEQKRRRHEELMPIYKDFVSTWGFPMDNDFETWRPGWRMGSNSTREMREGQWIHWHASHLATLQSEEEAKAGAESDAPPAHWLSRLPEQWIAYRTILLEREYTELTSYWVPTLDEVKQKWTWQLNKPAPVHEILTKVQGGYLASYVCYHFGFNEDILVKSREKTIIELAKEHAKDECAKGKLIVVPGHEQDDVIPPPTPEEVDEKPESTNTDKEKVSPLSLKGRWM